MSRINANNVLLNRKNFTMALPMNEPLGYFASYISFMDDPKEKFINLYFLLSSQTFMKAQKGFILEERW